MSSSKRQASDSPEAAPQPPSVRGRRTGPAQDVVYSTSADDELPLCSDCQQIDFDAILAHPPSGRWKAWQTLNHIASGAPACRLCAFFLAHAPEWTSDPSTTHALFSRHLATILGSNKLRDTHILVVGEYVGQVPKRIHSGFPWWASRQGLPIMWELRPDGPSTLGSQRVPEATDYAALRGWLTYCDMHHDKPCKATEDEQLEGFQVIDCRERRVIPWEEEMRTAGYVTLSYVWGSSATGYSDAPNDNTGALPAVVPLVVDDSITVTLSLGFRYLWIDRYCMPQHDGKIRAQQIQSMNLVYHNSALTIIAAAGGRSDAGLPGVSEIKRTSQRSVVVGRHRLTYPLLDIASEVNESVWNSRGWTYQEGLLARRRLVFTQSQAYFQCAEMCCIESLALSTSVIDTLHHKNKKQLFRDVNLPQVFPLRSVAGDVDSFAKRVREFQGRNFTFEKDRYDAFRGILKVFANMKDPILNLYGLPICSPTSGGTHNSVEPQCNYTDMLAIGLTWKIDGTPGPYTYDPTEDPSSDSGNKAAWYGASSTYTVSRCRALPSWTWLGWKLDIRLGKIFFSFERETTNFAIQMRDKRESGSSRYTLIDIQLEDEKGEVKDWEVWRRGGSVNEQVLRAEPAAPPPRFILIRGRVMRLRLRVADVAPIDWYLALLPLGRTEVLTKVFADKIATPLPPAATALNVFQGASAFHCRDEPESDVKAGEEAFEFTLLILRREYDSGRVHPDPRKAQHPPFEVLALVLAPKPPQSAASASSRSNRTVARSGVGADGDRASSLLWYERLGLCRIRLGCSIEDGVDKSRQIHHSTFPTSEGQCAQPQIESLLEEEPWHMEVIRLG